MADVPAKYPSGPVEARVRSDVEAIVTAHPMGESLAAMAVRLAALLDGEVSQMAAAGINRELRENLLELARLEVSKSDDLDEQLSRPSRPGVSAPVRDAPQS